MEWVERITFGIEVAGIATVVVGGILSLAAFVLRWRRGVEADANVVRLRSSLGRSILLGLEFLVAADIISTVAIEPTLNSLAVLAGIVMVRTFLSFSLEIEIEGRLPWQRDRART